MDSGAIELIQQSAVDAAKPSSLGTFLPALFHDDKIIPIEHLQEGRARFRGRLQTKSLEDFINYAKINGGQGFIDADSASAKVFFNLGDTTKPGHGDWTATLQLEPTAEYAALLGILGKRLSQRDLLDFGEDWADHITFLDSDRKPIATATALNSIRKLTIKASSEAKHEEKDFGARKSAIEEIEASAENGIPYAFGFTAIPYPSFTQRSFTLRLSVLTSAEKPQLVLRAVALESAKEAIAQEFKRLLVDGIGAAATLTVGTFTP